MRYFIELSYKGTRFHGWQLQGNAYTVQAELNRALNMLFRQYVPTYGCGRTDTGVHARQFFAQFDLPDTIEIENADELVRKLNSILLPDICLYRIFEVAPNASTRFDAISRTYKYFISTYKNPFWQEFAYYFPYPLNIRKMNNAAKLLLQTTEFGSFVKAHAESKTNICNVTHAHFVEDKRNRLITFTITSNRFLRNMVRAVVGTLLDVGNGKSSQKDMLAVIDSQNRSNAGASAPAAGLFLWEVKYPYI
ncbi:tRNA pseudouridine synthase A [Bacteroidia bacterium]|nr:tRNA pseudouridine synthase A [Bacteroidia bacterium]